MRDLDLLLLTRKIEDGSQSKYLFGTNIRDHELLALSKRFHFLAVDFGFCKELTSHGLCSFFEEQTCLRAIGLASGGSPWITFHAVNNEVSIFSGG